MVEWSLRGVLTLTILHVMKEEGYAAQNNDHIYWSLVDSSG